MLLLLSLLLLVPVITYEPHATYVQCRRVKNGSGTKLVCDGSPDDDGIPVQCRRVNMVVYNNGNPISRFECEPLPGECGVVYDVDYNGNPFTRTGVCDPNYKPIVSTPTPIRKQQKARCKR